MNKLRKILSRENYKRVKSIYLRILSLPFGNNLNKLAQIYKSDKYGKHFYTIHYQHHFRKFKFKRVNLLEIGVGGYHFPDIGGNSLRMWKRYFPFGRISSIDIYDKTFFQERRIKIFQGSQTDTVFLKKVINQIGSPDIIIDDGSHINSHVIETFQFLFPFLKEGGIYVIEDTETSYWPDYGGDSENLNNPNTSVNYFKKLVDCLNHKEFLLHDYEPSYYDLNIISIQFYHNLIFIFKGINNEPSGIDPNNEKSTQVDELYF